VTSKCSFVTSSDITNGTIIPHVLSISCRVHGGKLNSQQVKGREFFSTMFPYRYHPRRVDSCDRRFNIDFV
jgi:hypothetical protein